jgi:hypothetical protein
VVPHGGSPGANTYIHTDSQKARDHSWISKKTWDLIDARDNCDGNIQGKGFKNTVKLFESLYAWIVIDVANE